MEKVCGVSGINPETEVLHSIGSKAALSILPAALINPGDYVLMTTPGYPVFGTHAKYYGGLVHNLRQADSPLAELRSAARRLDCSRRAELRSGGLAHKVAWLWRIILLWAELPSPIR